MPCDQSRRFWIVKTNLNIAEFEKHSILLTLTWLRMLIGWEGGGETDCILFLPCNDQQPDLPAPLSDRSDFTTNKQLFISYNQFGIKLKIYTIDSLLF